MAQATAPILDFYRKSHAGPTSEGLLTEVHAEARRMMPIATLDP